MFTRASTAEKVSVGLRSNGTINSLSFQCQDGTIGTVILDVCSVTPKELISCAKSATTRKQREREMSVNTTELKEKLRKLLLRDKQKEAADQIEVLAKDMLGDDNFIFDREAQTLAEIDTQKLLDFVTAFIDLRQKLDTSYYFATKKLLGDDNGES